MIGFSSLGHFLLIIASISKFLAIEFSVDLLLLALPPSY